MSAATVRAAYEAHRAARAATAHTRAALLDAVAAAGLGPRPLARELGVSRWVACALLKEAAEREEAGDGDEVS